MNLFPENRQDIASLDNNIRQFNKTYMMVKGYLDDAAFKLRQMFEVSKEVSGLLTWFLIGFKYHDLFMY